MAGPRADGDLLERDEELALLRDASARTAQGRGSVVIIEGPAGIGKTRLLQAAWQHAAQTAVGVTWARASELEREYGFGVLRQLLEPAVMSAAGHLRDGLFNGAAALAAPLFLRSASSGAPAVETDYATLHGLYWLLAELADEQPLLLCVDDIQWADPPSLRFLGFAGRRIDNLAVSIFATLRTGEVGSEPGLVSQLLTEPDVITVRPRALSAGGVATIVRRELARDAGADVVEACLDSTGGNPFYLKALLSELEPGATVADEVRRITEIGSEQISAVLLRRLRALPVGAAELARAVAVLADGTGIGRAAALAGLAPAAAEDVLHALVSARFLVAHDGLAFTHPILRSSVYASLAARTRSELHIKAAQQLQRDGARLEEVARHLVHALPAADLATVATLRAAARRSLAVGAPESAAGFLQRALLEPPADSDQAEILLELGRAEMRAGLAPAADHLQQVMEHAGASPEQRGLAALDLGEFLMHTLRGNDGIRVLEAGLAATRKCQPELAKRIEATLIFNAYGHLAPRRQLLPRLRALKPPTDTSETDPIRLLFAALSYDEAFGAGKASTAIFFAEQCLAYRGPIHGSTEATARALAICGLLGADRPAEAEAHADRTIDIARASGSITVFMLGSASRANIRQRRGHLPAAEADARAVLGTEAPGTRVVRPLALGVVVESLAARGAFDAAEAAVRSIDREQVVEVPTWLLLLMGIIDLRLAQGEPQRAVDEARHFPAFEAEWGVGRGVGLYEWRWRASAAHLAAGDADAAREIADEQMSLAGQFGSARSQGIALRSCALLEPEPERVEMLRTALPLLPPERSALERTRTLIELGAALRRSGHRAAARQPLQEGLELARECGALLLAKRAHTELRAAGGHPRSPLRTGLDALTPSERRVAEMAAEGLSNAEAAQALFVTVKTVEMHLSNSYRKLGIRSRSQLQAALALPSAA